MITVLLVNIALVVSVVVIHYEFLYRLTSVLPRLNIPHRFRIIFGVCGALLAHVVEVWVFAFAYFFMNRTGQWGSLSGSFDGSLLDCVYFSFTTFTTLGFGDINATGELRHLTGIEALTGFVMITWTASFLYLEMQRGWGTK